MKKRSGSLADRSGSSKVGELSFLVMPSFPLSKQEMDIGRVRCFFISVLKDSLVFFNRFEKKTKLLLSTTLSNIQGQIQDLSEGGGLKESKLMTKD